MDQEEENKYVSQLQEVFNSCDTTGTGYLDKEELTDLCQKLHLDAQLPLLLQTLLGDDIFARVNFDEFKEGFVAVLSSTIDISISEDESSYLEPVIPDEVKPKFVKGTKRYGRRTQPELEAAENEANKYMQEQHHVKCKRKGQLRRSSSLESVESLKSDEEAESAKEPHNENCEAQGQLRVWDTEFFVSPGRDSNLYCDMAEHQVRGIWEELAVGQNGYLNQQELATVCQKIGLQDLSKEEIEDLFNKLDRDGDGRVSFVEFQLGLFSHAPVSSTPLKHRRPRALSQVIEDSSRKTATSSMLSCCGAIHLFSSIDDGSGFGNPEQILIIWEEEGIEDSKDILMMLDFNLEEQVNLLDLTTALDNELIATKNRMHLAALASYKHEVHHQHWQIDQVTRERDKIKQDLEKAEKRNLQLADEVDDHNSVMEQLNESKIKELEHEYRQKLSLIRTELESEKDQFLQNTDQQRTKMESDLASFQMEESYLRDKLNLSIKENSRLQKEMVEIVGKLSHSERQVAKLQTTVNNILKEKGVIDPHNSELFIQEEKFAEIIKEYETQCRELRDRNDELQVQLETLRSQLSESKYSRLLAKMKDNKLIHHKAKEKVHLGNGSPGKKGLTTRLRRCSSASGAHTTLQSESPPMNMETELTKHQLKEQHQEIQDLKIQLETKVNYYEREMELMKSNFEKERKDTEQNFKIEINELEEQKADLEKLNEKYQEVIDSLKEQRHKTTQIQEMEKRFEKERAEMEQYYAKEISTLDKKLTSEKDELEEEIKRSHQHELQTMREKAKEELNQQLSVIEAQYADYCESILQRHHQEKQEALGKHEADIKALIQEHITERAKWEEREKTLKVQWKKEQLKLEEKQNEEQALLCKAFALEKERIESQYRIDIDRLSEEIQVLNGRLVEQESYSCSMEENEQKEKQSLVIRQTDCLEDGLVSPNQQPFSQSVFVMGTGEDRACATGKDQLNTLKIACAGNLEHKNESIEMQIKPAEDQHLQYAQVLSSFKVAQERLALLKKTETNTLLQLQEMEGELSSLREQLQEEIKEKEMLLKSQDVLEKEKAQLVSQMKAKEEKCLLSEVKERKPLAQIRESYDCIQMQDPRIQVLLGENEELQKQVVDFQSVISELENKVTLMKDKEQELTAQLAQKDVFQNICQSLQGVEETHLVEEVIHRNVLLSQQLGSKEEELVILQSKIKETTSKIQQVEEEAAKRVHDALSDLEKEKDNTKHRLFELEVLVREIETTTSLDNRFEISRLSEDNSSLRNKVERLQQEVGGLEDINNIARIQLEDLKRENKTLHSDLQEMGKQNEKYRDELYQLNTKSLQLNSTVSELSAQNVGKQETIQELNSRLQEVTRQKEQLDVTIEKLQDSLSALEKDTEQKLSAWKNERERLEQDLQVSNEENEKYRDELYQLNTQSLQLKGRVSNLSAQNTGTQETIQELNGRLQEVTQKNKQLDTTVEKLQDSLSALENENRQQVSSWKEEKEQLEQRLQVAKVESDKYRDMLCQLNTQSLQLNSTVSDLTAKNVNNQETIQGLNRSLQEVTRQKEKMDEAVGKLQDSLSAMETEKLQQVSAWKQEKKQLDQELRMSKEKLLALEELQEHISALRQEKQNVEDKYQQMSKRLQQTTDQVTHVDEMESDLKHARDECLDLRRIQAQLKEELDESQDQLLEANTKLMLAQSQHMREMQQLKEQVSSSVPKDQLTSAQNSILEEQQKVQQLQEKLRFIAEEANRQLAMQQNAHEKLLRKMENRMESVEMDLKKVRIMLQEKVSQLKEQLEKNTKSDFLLKDLYVENAHLMKALQVTEKRQKSAEKKNYVLEEKILALNKVLKKIAPTSLAV
ncbi:ninein-like protein [Pelodytes ibericus]